MAQPVAAADLIALFRVEGEEGNAWKVAFQTDLSTDESRDYESEATKDGVSKSAGAYEGSHSLSAFLAKGDTYIAKLKELVRDKSPKRLEVWTLDRSDLAAEGGLDGDYSIDVVTSLTVDAGAEGNVEVSIETEIAEGPVAGKATVTPELTAMLKQISEELEFVQPVTPAS